MGNLLGHQQPDWVPNIVPGEGIQRPNDLNNPVSAQIRDTFLSYAIPTGFIIAFARAAHQFHQDRSRLVEAYTNKLQQLESELEQLRENTDATKCQLAANHRIEEFIHKIDREETVTYTQHIRTLDWYDEGLKRILEIRCSPFKFRSKREVLENELLAKVAADHSIKDVSMYPGIRDSIDFDYRYCGTNRENNGKFRQIYMQMYRQKLLLAKERRVMERVKKELKTVD